MTAGNGAKGIDMKYMRFFAAFAAGALLLMLGFFTLGVPGDLPFWRWLFGVGLLGGALIVWDTWA